MRHLKNGFRANYDWSVRDGCVVIVDRDGAKSVTNDAENVVDDLVRHGIDLEANCIVYLDTMGRWDGLLTRDVAGRRAFVSFVPLGCKTGDQAIAAMKAFMAAHPETAPA